MSLQRQNARSPKCACLYFYSTPHSMDRTELCQLRVQMSIPPQHPSSYGQTGVLLSWYAHSYGYSWAVFHNTPHSMDRTEPCSVEYAHSSGCLWIQLHNKLHPVDRIDFTVRQRRYHLTFASYFKDGYILTSVIFQGCFVFAMVLLRQLRIKHIPYLYRNQHHNTRLPV